MRFSERRHPRAPPMPIIVKAKSRPVGRLRMPAGDLRANGVMLAVRACGCNACTDCLQPADVREFQLIKSQPDS